MIPPPSRSVPVSFYPHPSLQPRPAPIRDAILAFLTEPRSARAIADHIGRSVPIATGHLAAMRRKGLVRRLGYAAYAARRLRRPGTQFLPSQDRSCR